MVKKKFKHIGVTSSSSDKNIPIIAKQLFEVLKNQNIEIFLDEKLKLGKNYKTVSEKIILEKAELGPVSTIGLYKINPLTMLLPTFQNVVERAKRPPAEPPPTNILFLSILSFSAFKRI